MEQQHITRQDVLAQFLQSPHGNLAAYIPVGRLAARHEPDFLAHALVYDRHKGSIRDAQVGMPVVTLATKEYPHVLRENSLALLACLSPRDLLRAWRFAHGGKKSHRSTVERVRTEGWLVSERVHKKMERMVRAYLKAREACWPWWERTVLHFESDLRSLYALTHTKPDPNLSAGAL
jgi:hypothetical protein